MADDFTDKRFPFGVNAAKPAYAEAMDRKIEALVESRERWQEYVDTTEAIARCQWIVNLAEHAALTEPTRIGVKLVMPMIDEAWEPFLADVRALPKEGPLTGEVMPNGSVLLQTRIGPIEVHQFSEDP